MKPASTVAEWLTWAAAVPKLPRDLTDENQDAPEPDPREDHLLDRHRADVDERYSDRAWDAA